MNTIDSSSAGRDGHSLSESALNGKWLDFYTLLHVAPDADEGTLRKRIGVCYAEASANCDHRDLSRRHYYQTMVERVLPQCRRVLLSPELRARYDEQQRLHAANDPAAVDYVAFMASLSGSGASSGGKDLKDLQAILSSDRNEGWENLPEKVREEIESALAVVECVESGSALELLPATAVSFRQESHQDTSPPEHDSIPVMADDAPAKADLKLVDTPENDALPAMSAPEAAAPVAVAPATVAPATVAPATAAPPAPAPSSRVIKAPRAMPNRTASDAGQIPGIRPDDTDLTGNASQDSNYGRSRRGLARPASGALDATPVFATAAGPRRARTSIYQPRVIVGEVSAATGSASAVKLKGGKRPALSPLSLNLLTGIVAVLLYTTIQNFSDTPANAVSTNRTPLTVVYSSELRPVMEQAERAFEASKDGQNVDVVLQPMDSRLALSRTLNADTTGPDVWIPSESMWSDRYNQVAAKFKHRSIVNAAPLTLSPIVLIARGDHAADLLTKFPNHTIPTWDALRSAVIANAPGHFGMTDPGQSGSGAITRSFMAREWCEHNGVAWNDAALANPALWKWMSGFEENVPSYAKMAGDMAKDLALGTSGRYWWALAYESDAMYWLNQGKPLEIFYLPRTNYADHPYCNLEHVGSSPQTNAARVAFEKFLRGDAMQTAMLQNGFRPTEIDLSTRKANNPFARQDFQQRGARITGFKLDERLNYRIINDMNAQWEKRFNS